jgi:hypothetical protein
MPVINRYKNVLCLKRPNVRLPLAYLQLICEEAERRKSESKVEESNLWQ